MGGFLNDLEINLKFPFPYLLTKFLMIVFELRVFPSHKSRRDKEGYCKTIRHAGNIETAFPIRVLITNRDIMLYACWRKLLWRILKENYRNFWKGYDTIPSEPIRIWTDPDPNSKRCATIRYEPEFRMFHIKILVISKQITLEFEGKQIRKYTLRYGSKIIRDRNDTIRYDTIWTKPLRIRLVNSMRPESESKSKRIRMRIRNDTIRIRISNVSH